MSDQRSVSWDFEAASHALCQGGWNGTSLKYYILVGGLEHFSFPYIGNNNPNWLLFFRGVETSSQYIYNYIYICIHIHIHTYTHTYLTLRYVTLKYLRYNTYVTYITSLHTYIHACIHTYIYIYIHIHIHIHTYTHPCIHTSIHPYIHPPSIHPYIDT